jgi:hypothetical protein
MIWQELECLEFIVEILLSLLSSFGVIDERVKL